MENHEKCRDEQNYLKARLNELKVRSVSELIFQSKDIQDFLYIQMLEEAIFEWERSIKTEKDQESLDITVSLLERNKKGLEEAKKGKDMLEFYKKISNTYYNYCKFLFD